MNNGILASQPFSVTTDLVGIKPLLGVPQSIPIPYHFPLANNFRIGNDDGVSNKDFVFVVDTTILGSTTISMPLRGLAGNIQVVDWGDGTYGAIAPAGTQRAGSFETVFVYAGTVQGTTTHTYAKHGIYTVVLRGILGLGNGSIPAATAFLSYGDTNYTTSSLSHAFCNNIYVPPQIPTSISNIAACFQGSSRFNHPNVTLWDVSRITNMQSLFNGASSFNQNLDSWANKVDGVNNFFLTFFNATSFDGSVSGWNLIAPNINCQSMFNSCSNFTGKGIPSWNTRGVTNMNAMFTNCPKLYLGTSGNWNWNVTGVTDISSMFVNAGALQCDLSEWNLCNCTNMTNFMLGCNIGSGNYDILLNSWATTSTGNPVKPWATGINVHFGTARYTAASSGARQRLVNYGWTITDGGFQA